MQPVLAYDMHHAFTKTKYINTIYWIYFTVNSIYARMSGSTRKHFPHMYNDPQLASGDPE